jgi:hypothetical protein
MEHQMKHLRSIAFVFVLLASAKVFAQSYQGEVRGLVVDPNKSIVVGATVTLVDEAKNVSRTTVSDGAGQYVFTQVDPAKYAVQVESAGFKAFRRTEVVVGTQQSVTVDISLAVGDTSETVQVSAGETALDTTNGSTSTALLAQKLEDLPTSSGNGRNQYTVANISQNVLPVIRGSGFIDQSDTSTVSVAGSPESTNLYLVDGVPITDTINRPVIIPITEATQELKVQVTTYDAEVGRTGGGVYNTLLKSGTSSLHGSLYGVTRQSVFSANDFFNNRAGIARPDVPFYSYAGSLGGPIILPHYDGRKRKTFFFIAEEGFREAQALSSYYQVPTALERQGDFSQSGVTIYNPFSTTVGPNGQVTRTPFPGNVIPKNLINSIGSNIASFYPQPNVTGVPSGAVNFTLSTPGPQLKGDEFVGKIDQQLFPWWSANVSYMHYSSLIPFGDALQTLPGSGSITYNRHVDATQLNNIFTVNPTTLVSVRFGFNRFPNTILPLSAGYDPSNLGLPAYNYQYSFFPPVNVTGFTPLSAATASTDVWYSRNLFTQVAKEFGRHSTKAGFDFRAIDMSFTDFSNAPGSFNFSGQFTQANPSQPGGGSAIADLLLGLPVSGQIESSQKFYNYVHYWGAYVQDEFRATPKLTLTAGLRYEYETGLKDANNNEVVGFNSTVASPLARFSSGTVGGLEFAGTGGRSETGIPSKLNFAPRLGYAYSPGKKTVIRGGFGIYNAPHRYDATAALQPGFTTETQLISSNNNYQTPAPGFTLNNPFPGGPQAPTGNVNGLSTGIGEPIAAYDQNLKSPVIYQFSSGIQSQLPGQIVLDIDYVGSRGRHLIPSPQGGGSASPAGGGRTNIDQLNPQYFGLGSDALSAPVTNPYYQAGGPGLIGQPTVPRQQLLLPFPQFSAVNLIMSDSSSSYNSMVIKVERRFAAGFTFLATYTWSRNYDGSYGTSSPSGSANQGPQNIYNLAAEYGRSFIDVPQRVTLMGTYNLPFGRGKQFLNGNGVTDALVGGWQVSAVTTYQSGFPLNISQTNYNASIGAAVQRPNINPGVSEATHGSAFDRVDGYINPLAFTTVPEYTFGNLPKTASLRGPGPGNGNWDAALHKTIRLERVNIAFRVEAENLFNHPWFSLPNTVLGNANFGKITSDYNNPRSLQIGGRVTF